MNSQVNMDNQLFYKRRAEQMGAWSESLMGSDDAQEAVDCFITNVQELKRPLTDRPTLIKVFDDTLTELNISKDTVYNEVKAGALSVAVLAIGEHLRLHGVTLYPLRDMMSLALTAELTKAKSWTNPRKRKGVLNQFATRVGL